MRKIILDFPKQFKIGLKAAESIKIPRVGFDAVLVSGMGGSALPADLLEIWLSAYKISLPLHIHRSYQLPHQADERHLIICISYSGNTEETLTAFEEAREKKLKIIAITSGGKLAKLCKKHEIPSAIIPGRLPPRLALGYQFSALMKILANCQVIENNLKNISALEKSLKPKSLENQGKKLAKKLKNKIPLIYASNKLRALAYFWKISFNENSKSPAFSNYFPELNHNELVGFSRGDKRFSAIILQDRSDHPRIQKRMKLTAEILKAKGLGVDIINIKGKDILYKIFSDILLSNWASYYLALEYGVDPVPVKIIEELKRKLK